MTTRSETLYLILSPRKTSGLSARIAMRPPMLGAKEVAMELAIRVPAALFERPALHGTITVPVEQVNRPVINAAIVDNIKAELQRTLGVEITLAIIEPPTPEGTQA
jgi:hypothetical protein